ncbi:MAG: TolC family protein [Desulfobacula sp.]|nr:TolC family protein [Desulfobacula sp.]
MNKTLNQLCFIFFIILFARVSAYPQTTYTLYELTQIASKQSETIKIAEDDLYIAQQDKVRALSVLLPRATSYGSLTQYQNKDASIPYSLTKGIKLTQSFTLNGKELIALDVTRRSIEGKKFSLDSVRAEYLLQVSQAYYNILSAQRYLEIAQTDVKRLETHRNAVKEKLSVGNVTKTDLYRAQAELSKSLSEQVRAKNNVLQAKATLLSLVDIKDDYAVSKKEINNIDNYQCILEDIESYAMKNRPEIKEAQKNLEIARKTIKYNKSSYWPEVSLEAGYKQTEIEYNFGQIQVKTESEDKYVTGELVFTLFDGGLRRAEIRQAIADERKARNALILEKKKILLDARISYLDFETAKSTLFNLKDELRSAQENYNAVQMQFKYGMADSIDMMDANTLLVTAQRRISDAEYIYYLSVLKIIYTKGDLTRFLLSRI